MTQFLHNLQLISIAGLCISTTICIFGSWLPRDSHAKDVAIQVGVVGLMVFGLIAFVSGFGGGDNSAYM